MLRDAMVYTGTRWWWRCVNCGERVDRDILRNRAEQEASVADRAAAQERDLREWAQWFSSPAPA